MTWFIEDFEEHEKEWKKNPLMEEKEVLIYLGLNKENLQKLVEDGWIMEYERGIYDRAEIIAFSHEYMSKDRKVLSQKQWEKYLASLDFDTIVKEGEKTRKLKLEYRKKAARRKQEKKRVKEEKIQKRIAKKGR